jgi:hypothetical protein
MDMTKYILDCRFKLHVVWFTIRSKKTHEMLCELSKFMQKGMTVPEKYTNHPILPDIFEKRTHFNFGTLGKVFLIHQKNSAKQGIDALLVIQDVSLISLLQVEQILKQMPSVSDFHFCNIEFTWDFYPDRTLPSPVLQKKIIQPLHFSHVRRAWYVVNEKYINRITYYYNDRKSDFQAKVYIRPKTPYSTTEEFVRLELTAKTRWLHGIDLVQPSDFLKLTFEQLVYQLSFLEFDWDALQRSNQFHLLSGGQWLGLLKNECNFLGIAYCILKYKKQNICPPQCKNRGKSKICPVYEAHQQQYPGYEIIQPMHDCVFSIDQPRFKKNYCKKSRHHDSLMKIMKDAYDTWKQPPLFPVRVQPLTQNPISKPMTKKPTRKGRKIQTNNSKIKLHKLF